MAGLRVVDVQDEATFGLLPPCLDGRFDHRTCDYWEDADRGSKQARPSWLLAPKPAPIAAVQPPSSDNPFAPPPRAAQHNPFADPDAAAELGLAMEDNPFAPPPPRPAAGFSAPSAASPGSTASAGGERSGLPRKLALLTRGTSIFGSYAKVLLDGDRPLAWSQFGPLSAYPRAARLRELYPKLPQAPLPAVITCIASAPGATDAGHAARLVEAVCEDLAGRGFSAVEAYPDLTLPETATSAARPAFWHAAGFSTAAEDERFPVMRREL